MTKKRTVKVPDDYASLPQKRLVSIVSGLLEVIGALESENEELRRAAKRQASPFSKGKKKGKRKKPGRKPGQGPFTNRKPPASEDVTDHVTVDTPSSCPRCGCSDLQASWEDAWNTELPEPRPKVTHYRRPVCDCGDCGLRWRAPHPELAADQFGATAHRLGTRLRSAAHFLHYRLGLPVCKTPAVLLELHGVKVTQSALTQNALRTAKAGPLRQRYEQIKADIAESPVVHVDPTGWRKAGKSASLNVFATPSTSEEPGKTLYQVRDHHGSDEIVQVLGEEFDGVLVSDRGPEFDANKLKDWKKQKCNTHIKRNINKVLEDKTGPARRFGEELRTLLDEARQLRRDHDAGKCHGYDAKVADLEDRLAHHLRDRTFVDPDNQRLLDGIGAQNDQGHLVRFLHDFNLSPDNHLAEQQIRFAVIARKVSHCSKNDAGADAHSVHSTVYQTENRAHQHQQTGPGLVDRMRRFFRIGSRGRQKVPTETGSATEPTAETRGSVASCTDAPCCGERGPSEAARRLPRPVGSPPPTPREPTRLSPLSLPGASPSG